MKKQVYTKLAILLIIVSTVLLLSSTLLLRQGLLSIEQIVLRQQLEMFSKLMQTKQQDFVGRTRDWAVWDDMYAYVQGRNPGFASNFHENTFVSARINYIICLAKDGRVLTALGYDLKKANKIAVPPDLIKKLTPKVLNAFADKNGILSGYVKTNDKLLTVAAVPVNTNNNDSVSNGWLIFAADLDDNYFALLNQIKNTRTVLDTGDFASLAKETGSSVKLADGTDVVLQYNNGNSVSGQIILKDISNNPVAGLRIDLPRSVMDKQGFYLAAASGVCVAVIVILAVGIYFIVGGLLKYLEE